MSKQQYILDNYEKLRGELVTGDNLVCSGKDVFSKLIKTFTSKKNYQKASHVAIIVVIKEYDRVMVAESREGKGVRFIRLSKYLTNIDNKGNPYTGKLSVYRHKEYQYHPELEKDLVKFVFDNLGLSYSARQISSIVFRIVTRMIPVRQIEEIEEYICSEFNEVCESKLNLYITKAKQNQLALPCDFTGPDFKLIGVLK